MRSTACACVCLFSASSAGREDVSAVETSDDELIDANNMDGGTERF